VIAKGVEDTAFYRYLRLTALNEVGGNPGRFSLHVDDFHRGNIERELRFPLHLLTTQTHDTKRSGDVRARITALTWLPGEWAERMRRWPQLDDPNESYLVYQTLIGAWPLEQERLEAYLEKALREAKANTSWLEPNEDHERHVRRFVSELYRDDTWRADFEPWAARVAGLARTISLGTTLLKLTVPGVPDVYQGDEIECLSLVDPDNRRPVDWELRRRLLAEGSDAKLEVVRRTLALRDRIGGYMPMEAGQDVCAFRRGPGVLVVVPLRQGASKSIPEAEGLRDVFPEYPVGLFV
jgi:(1->4)-alpha-D-glucan 1-alpha-D-glucosylmutase